MYVVLQVRPICTPKVSQEVMYNGHKRVHAIKWQSVNAAIGLIIHLYGPVSKYLIKYDSTDKSNMKVHKKVVLVSRLL